MRKISPKSRKNANLVYNQCVIYLLAAGAMSLAFIIPMKTKKPSAPVIAQSLLAIPADMPQITFKEQPASLPAEAHQAEQPIVQEKPKKVAVQQPEA